jgi:hypothetical protein
MLKTILLQSNPDPMAKAGGTVAVICGQQSAILYPVYLHAIAGSAVWPAWLTLSSMPFFVAVPAVARRRSLAGRVFLPIAGVANTVLCVKLFGRRFSGRIVPFSVHPSRGDPLSVASLQCRRV